MPRLVDVLQTLGASRQRDGTWSIDLAALQLGSLFGGDLEGVGAFSIQADSIVFKSPAELAACGALWLPDVQDEDALCQSIALAIDDLKQQTRASLTTLRRLGFKARIVAPEPHARGAMQIDGVSVGVLIDSNGHLVVDEVGGRAITSTQRRSLMAPDEATPAKLCNSWPPWRAWHRSLTSTASRKKNSTNSKRRLATMTSTSTTQTTTLR